MSAHGEYDMTDLLMLIVTERADGLSVVPGQAPAVRVRGEVHAIDGPSISPEHAKALLRSLAVTRQMRDLHEHGRTDFLFTFRETARFRLEARRENDEVRFQIQTIEL